jgi:hypothetical protein
MRTVTKVFVFIGALFSSIVLPIILNVAGFIGLGTAIGLFLLLFSMIIVFGGGYGLVKLLQMRSPMPQTIGKSSQSDNHGNVLDDINDELKSMEGNDPITTFRGEELTTEQRIIPDPNNEQKVFFAVVGPKKNSKQIVNVIYSPNKIAPNGSPVWRYDDDPSPAKREDPFHEFKPFGGRNTFRPMNEERQDTDGGININLENQSNRDDEYREF